MVMMHYDKTMKSKDAEKWEQEVKNENNTNKIVSEKCSKGIQCQEKPMFSIHHAQAQQDSGMVGVVGWCPDHTVDILLMNAQILCFVIKWHGAPVKCN